jgi:hypothetical protein
MLVEAQSVTDYFHTTANYYINGKKKEAKQTILEAIQKYPNDPKLKQLAAKINKLPDEKDNKNKQNKPDKQNDKKDDKKQNKDQQKKQQSQPQQPQMSKQNAQQILDALQQDEKNAQDKAKRQQVRGSKKADKDW